MKQKDFLRFTCRYFNFAPLVLALFLFFPRLGTAQVLKITEVITWMNASKTQTLGTLKAKQFVFDGEEVGFLKFSLKYSLGICHLTIAFKNGKLNAISWNEYVGYAGELRRDAMLSGFGEGEMIGELYSFKNYERRLLLTLIDHSATANEIVVAIGRMTQGDIKQKKVARDRQYLDGHEAINGNLKLVDKEPEFVGRSQALNRYQKMPVYSDLLKQRQSSRIGLPVLKNSATKMVLGVAKCRYCGFHEKFVTNLSLNLLKRPRIGRFHFLYWEVDGARWARVLCSKSGVICFLVVDSMLLFEFGSAFCGGNWVANVGISDHEGRVECSQRFFPLTAQGIVRSFNNLDFQRIITVINHIAGQDHHYDPKYS